MTERSPLDQVRRLANDRYAAMRRKDAELKQLHANARKAEMRELALMKVMLEAELMLSELRIAPAEKCQMAYDHLHNFRMKKEN